MKKCRRHYGVLLSLPFREGIDPIEKRYTDKYSGKKYCFDRIEWLISKVSSDATISDQTGIDKH
jgi:hypothetical protein